MTAVSAEVVRRHQQPMAVSEEGVRSVRCLPFSFLFATSHAAHPRAAHFCSITHTQPLLFSVASLASMMLRLVQRHALRLLPLVPCDANIEKKLAQPAFCCGVVLECIAERSVSECVWQTLVQRLPRSGRDNGVRPVRAEKQKDEDGSHLRLSESRR